LRIVHIIDYFQPKLGYQETFLAREHAKSGHEVYVVTSDLYNPGVYFDAQDMLGPRKTGTGFFIEEGIRVWRLRTLFELPNIIWIVGLESKVQELKPDVVIMHGITNFSAVRLARLKKKTGEFKLVYDDHATPDNAIGIMRVLYPLFRWTFSGLIQKSADALVAILPETKAFMQEKYGIPFERIITIPLGADDELFRFEDIARSEVRRELAISNDDIVVIFTGKIVPGKKLHTLIEAAADLMVNHSNIKVMLVGNGPQSYIEELKYLVSSKNLENEFTWHGLVPNEQLYKYYSAADISIWPFGASIGMREAMACSLPLIIGENARVSELIEYGNGLLFREGDSSDLMRQIAKLLDPDLRKQMGRDSRRLIEDKFNWKMIARQFIE